MAQGRQWILIGVALLGGAAGGWSLPRAEPVAAARVDVCGAVLERVEALEDEIARARTERTRDIEQRAPSSGALEIAAAGGRRTPPIGPAVADTLERLDARIDELLDASLCRSPEALAAEEDAARLESPRNRDAVEEAHRIVDYALDRGVWRESDAQGLREAFAWMTRSQRDELLNVLIPAFQSGLEVESFPPL